MIPGPTNGLVGVAGTIENDVLSFRATGCTVADNASLTVEQNGTQTTLTNGTDGVTITSTDKALEVRRFPDTLSANEPIRIVPSTGIECGGVTVTGTLATTTSGDVALKTEGGKGDQAVLPFVAETTRQQEQLQELAAKKPGKKVDITGVKELKKDKGKASKDTFKVKTVKKAKTEKQRKK